MKKINLHNNDINTILTISLLQSKLLHDINELFNTNVLDDINHGFIYDEVLRYITDTTFNPTNGFDKQTLKLFYGKENCWVIHNKLIELLQSSKDWWAQGGDFKVVLNFDRVSDGYFVCYIYYENDKNEDTIKNNQRNITILRIELFDKPSYVMVSDKKFISNAKLSLNILNKLISFSDCLGFYKWVDREKKIIELVDFSEIENVINKARDFIKDQKPKRFVNKKEFNDWTDSRLELLQTTLKTFNDLENNVLNHIEENNKKIKEEVIEEANEKELEKKEEKEQEKQEIKLEKENKENID